MATAVPPSRPAGRAAGRELRRRAPIVGLKLDVRVIRDTGSVALITGAVQIALTAVIGFGLALLLGLKG